MLALVVASSGPFHEDQRCYEDVAQNARGSIKGAAKGNGGVTSAISANVSRRLPVACASDKSHDDAESVQESNLGVEDCHCNDDRKHLLDVG